MLRGILVHKTAFVSNMPGSIVFIGRKYSALTIIRYEEWSVASPCEQNSKLFNVVNTGVVVAGPKATGEALSI